VRSDEEVLEYAGAFLQLYREEVFHLERTCHWLGTCHWLERVGLEHANNRVVEGEESRKTLHARLLAELQDARDPWAERVAGAERNNSRRIIA